MRCLAIVLSQALRPVLMSGKAIRADAWCYRHRRRCRHPGARTHIAGTPCTDESLLGSKRGGLDGKTSVFFMSWCGQRRLLQEPILQNLSMF